MGNSNGKPEEFEARRSFAPSPKSVVCSNTLSSTFSASHDSKIQEDMTRSVFDRKNHFHFEVVVDPLCPTPLNQLRRHWKLYFEGTDRYCNMKNGETTMDVSMAPSKLQESCSRVSVDFESSSPSQDYDSTGSVDFEAADAKQNHQNTVHYVYPYVLSDEEPSTVELDASGSGDDEMTAGCDTLPLPHNSLDGLWESLIMEDGIKQNLLEYAQTSLLFAEKGVSPHVIGWNRLLLLHGPPGTGKTSLCKALAQKIAIRMGERFASGTTLLEIHSHSLFSKWFSTSGKLVNKLFEIVRDMVQDDPESLVCVLIDEVESLASARTGMNGAEPQDAMRAVNSLLTSLDRLRSFSNVIILATTNLTTSVDLAFVDRADVKQYVGYPVLEARYGILRSCMIELERVGIIENTEDKISLVTYRQLLSSRKESSDAAAAAVSSANSISSYDVTVSDMLLSCAELAEGLSGRSLRKLPLQSHAQFIRQLQPVSMKAFLIALQSGIRAEIRSRQKLGPT
mmetsp:Transcript_9966/g.15370  ORF Transcript_9966/g.15370 Transcript_9966/m.15370 type:complete len:510 (+) Transcript_9966:70-1599(+)